MRSIVPYLMGSVAMPRAGYARMMALQSTVALAMGFGTVGTLFKDGPLRAQPGIIDTVGTVNANRIGRAFTATAGVGNDGHCGVGGTGAFYGILANPKVYALLGTTAGGTLAASMDLPQYAQAEFVYNTTGIIVRLENAANVGDVVDYDTTTGQLYARSAKFTPAAGTVAVTSNVATVAAISAGSPAIGVGTVLNTGGGPAVVQSLGTGTGGNGTYNVGAVPDSGASALSYTTSPAAGRAQVPNSQVVFYTTDAAGNAVISLNN